MTMNILTKTYEGIKSLLVGMGITFKYLVKKPVTMQYPEEKWAMPERYRGVVTLIKDEKTGKHRCIACMNCVRTCPNYSLSLEPAVDENKKKYPVKFRLEVDKCIFCGLCVEVCPTSALEMNKEYELAFYTREEMKKDLLQLK